MVNMPYGDLMDNCIYRYMQSVLWGKAIAMGQIAIFGEKSDLDKRLTQP